MEGAVEAGGPLGDPIGDRTPEEPSLHAGRLFARLTEEAGGPGDRDRSPSTRLPVGEPPRADGAEEADHLPDERPVIDLARAALAATDRIADVVGLLSAQTDTAAVELVELGRTILQALEATNERVASLERSLLVDRPAEAARFEGP